MLTPKFLRVGGAWLHVIETLNCDLHTYVELSGQLLELITIFEKFGLNWPKIRWVSLGVYTT